MITSSDTPVVLAAAGVATFDVKHLLQTGANRVLRIELRNLGGTTATYQLGGNGPTRSLVANEVYILERNIDTVTCVTGAIEVVFQT